MPRQIIVPRLHGRVALNTPLEIPGTAAWYSLEGLPSDSTYIKDGSNRVQLIADRSGNSNTNGLVMNGAVSNGASTPDSVAISITGDLDVRVYVALADWTPSALSILMGKRIGGTDFWDLAVNTNGTLNFFNKVANSQVTSANSTVAVPVSDFGAIWVRATYDVDNGAAGNDVIFYTSTDGSTWTKLGNTVTTAGIATLTDTTAALRVGTSDGSGNESTGIFFRAQLYNGIAGTLVFDANFANVAKLASSFTESSSNAATVTINTSGDTGARICGARDRVQLTQAKQAIWSAPGYATYDGSNDYDKSAPFSLSQPFIRYTAFKPIAWNSGNILWDGNAAGSAKLTQTGSTPNVQMNAGTAGAQRSTFVLGNWAVCVEEFNGASSSLQRNLDANATADAGSTAANGVTVGADGAGANCANIGVADRITYTGTHNAATKARVIDYLFRRCGVPRP